MATVRTGDHAVLLVVDVQNDVVGPLYRRDEVVANLAELVARARRSHTPVVWVRHSDEGLVHGSAGWNLVPELVPQADEVIIDKHFNSAFEQTTLADVLSQKGISKVILGGAESSWCIRATAYGAVERGYDVTLVADAHTTGRVELANGRVVEAQSIIDEFNTVFSWLSAPGRQVSAVKAAEVAL